MSLRDKIRNGEKIPLPISLALGAATPVQRLGMWWRLRGPRTKVDARVISYGNITAGGTGKTPAVIERAAREIAAGRIVAVVTRGYGSNKTPEPLLIAAGEEFADIATDAGDEPALIRARVPGVHLVKSADRVAGARAAIEKWGCDVIILDDGFQSVALERDEDIVLIDARNPFGNGRLVPRGILREPLPHLSRATEIILTRADCAKDIDAVEAQVRMYCGSAPLRRTRHEPDHLWQVQSGAYLPLEFLRGREVAAFCAIAQPEDFFATLEKLGARLTQRRAFPDHVRIPESVFDPGLPVIVTEKDAVRVRNAPENLFALAVSLVFYGGEAV